MQRCVWQLDRAQAALRVPTPFRRLADLVGDHLENLQGICRCILTCAGLEDDRVHVSRIELRLSSSGARRELAVTGMLPVQAQAPAFVRRAHIARDSMPIVASPLSGTEGSPNPKGTRMAQVDDAPLPRMTATIVEAADLEKAILFCSRARGDAWAEPFGPGSWRRRDLHWACACEIPGSQSHPDLQRGQVQPRARAAQRSFGSPRMVSTSR